MAISSFLCVTNLGERASKKVSYKCTCRVSRRLNSELRVRVFGFGIKLEKLELTIFDNKNLQKLELAISQKENVK